MPAISQGCCFGQGAVFAQQFTFEFLDARAVFARGLWAGPGILRVAQCRCCAGAPFFQLGGIDALLAAPGVLADLGHGRRCDHSLQARRRSPCPPSGGHGLNPNFPLAPMSNGSDLPPDSLTNVKFVKSKARIPLPQFGVFFLICNFS